MVTRTFVISIKSNKEGTGFAKNLLIIKTTVLKYVCYVEEHYSVTADVLKYLLYGDRAASLCIKYNFSRMSN